HRLHLERVLLSETAAQVRRDDLYFLGIKPQLLCQTVTDAFGVLGSLVDDQRSVAPLGHRRDELHRVVVLRWAREDGVDLDRGFGESLVRVPGPPGGENLPGRG